MAWALFILLIIISVVHWFDYSREVQEYIFAQTARLEDIQSVLSEKTPIVIEIGELPWRPEMAKVMDWSVTTENNTQSVQTWLNDPNRESVSSDTLLVESIGLETGLADIDDARAKWWIPGLQNMAVDVLKPYEVMGLSWIVAERQWVGCSSGLITVWLVHSRYRRYLPENKDPWTLTKETAPYIGRVQYIEVVLKPGWCIGLPAHWGYSIRNDRADGWIWMAEQHSPMSLLLNEITL